MARTGEKDTYQLYGTVSLKELPWELKQRDHAPTRKDIQELFQITPITEVQRICLERLSEISRGLGREDIRTWAAEEIDRRLKKNHFPVAVMILQYFIKEDLDDTFLKKLLQTLRYALKQGWYCSEYSREALVMLCGKLLRYPNLYSPEMRQLFTEMLDVAGFDEKQTDNSTHYDERIIERILLVVGFMGDTEMLPILEKRVYSPEELTQTFSFLPSAWLYGKDKPNISSEHLEMKRNIIRCESLRMIVTEHLRNLAVNRSSRPAHYDQ